MHTLFFTVSNMWQNPTVLFKVCLKSNAEFADASHLEHNGEVLLVSFCHLGSYQVICSRPIGDNCTRNFVFCSYSESIWNL